MGAETSLKLPPLINPVIRAADNGAATKIAPHLAQSTAADTSNSAAASPKTLVQRAASAVRSSQYRKRQKAKRQKQKAKGKRHETKAKGERQETKAKGKRQTARDKGKRQETS